VVEGAAPHARDIVRIVAADCFPGEDVSVVMDILDEYGVEPYERERERVQLGILKLSRVNVDRLLEFVLHAKRDYRDVLYWAEYFVEPAG